jgi:PAP2 superfamily
MKRYFLVATSFMLLISACYKSDAEVRSQLDGQSSKLIIDWIDLHVRLIRNTTGVTHPAYSRHFSYTGIALYETLVNGDKKLKSIAALLNGAPQMPLPATNNRIFYPAAANTALAQMLRHFYPAKEANLKLIDSVETAYKLRYQEEVKSKYDLAASAEFGKAVAGAVIEWSKTDGASGASIPYTPKGEGFWEPTPPAMAQPAVPGWGNNRLLLSGSLANTQVPAPPAFSKENGSAFYNMSKEVFDVAQKLTEEQKAIANFWDDLPNGKYVSVYGHWFNILKLVLQKENTSLKKAVVAYLQLGVSMHEATISCWKSKYEFHYMRPITYIRKYMGHSDWNSLFTTPAHPEYLSAHATFSASAAGALTYVFGNNYAFADNTYAYLGMATRNFSSFDAAGTEAGVSRLYAGIHFRPAIEAGKVQGLKVAENVKNMLSAVKSGE